MRCEDTYKEFSTMRLALFLLMDNSYGRVIIMFFSSPSVYFGGRGGIELLYLAFSFVAMSNEPLKL